MGEVVDFADKQLRAKIKGLFKEYEEVVSKALDPKKSSRVSLTKILTMCEGIKGDYSFSNRYFAVSKKTPTKDDESIIGRGGAIVTSYIY